MGCTAITRIARPAGLWKTQARTRLARPNQVLLEQMHDLVAGQSFADGLGSYGHGR
jgi:hypothetical protein